MATLTKLRSQDFKYKPLNSQDSIHLLLLQPGPPGLDLHGTLIHTTLAECYYDIYNQYTALSYVWGSTKEARVIFVEGRPLSITVNLAAALDDLRDDRNSLRLWIDAVCIDQSNIEERNHQVGLMREIYALARQSIVYLGGCDEHCKRVIDAVRDSIMDDSLQRLAITHILSRPWFMRVWVYQELVLSKEVWVQCGRVRVEWDRFCSLLLSGRPSMNYEDYEDDEDDEVQELDQAMAPLLKMQVARRKFRVSLLTDTAPETLLSVLLSRRGFGATDPRDLIYGHLAVAGLHLSSRNLIVDYQKSVIQVFADAARHIIESRGWKVLLHTEVSETKHRMKGLPSWVPDWSLSNSYSMPPLPSVLEGSYSASHGEDTAIFIYARKRVSEIQDITSVILAPANETIRSHIKDLEEGDIDSILVNSADGQVDPHKVNSELCRPIRDYWTQLLEDAGILGPRSQAFTRLFGFRDTLDIVSSTLNINMNYGFRGRGDVLTGSPRTLTHLFMNHFLETKKQSLLTGRKIALVSPHGLAIVPSEARRGDGIYFLPVGGTTHCVVLRPCTSAAPVTTDKQMILDLPATTKAGSAIKTLSFTLIGTAWVEFSSNAFKEKPDPKSDFDLHNIALC